MKRIRLGTATIGKLERTAINSVLDSGFVSPGDITKTFEERIAYAHGKKYGLALNSGQSAIMVVMEAAAKVYNITHVAVPAVTYISSITAIIQAGLKPMLVDVHPTVDAPMKYDEIPYLADAVLPCHLFGKPNAPFVDNRPHGTIKFVCEDACESIYAPGLGFGDAICLSFYPSHTITAGVGGMILTDDKDLYFKCWQLVNHGRQDMDDYTTCHTLKERFTFSEWGYSLKFSDLNAALGLAQHTRRNIIIGRRRDNALYLTDGLVDIEELLFANSVLNRKLHHTFMMFPIIVRGDERDALEKALNDANIETRRMMPITTQPIIKQYFGAYICEDYYPGAKYINEHGIYIGCHQDLSTEDLDRIVLTIRKFYNVV